MPSDWQDVEVEHGTIRLGVTSQGSPVESRYLTSKCYITKTTQLLGLKGTCLGLRAISQLA
jgi:hypothetical protein